MTKPFFSIIIATYNSEHTLAYTLKSIREQSIDQHELEIIVIDGGSTDNTKKIAEKYGAIIFDNPKRLPEYAKAIGVKYATGHYAMRMDSDEEFSYPTQLQDKMNFLKNHSNVKILLSNRYVTGRKDIVGVSGNYMNALGDPFSYFIYKTKVDKYQTYKNHIITENDRFAVMRFKQGDIYPLADSATCVLSLDYMRANFPEEYTTIEFTCGAYDRILANTELCGVIKGDDIKHNCSSSFKTYLSKLKFRVINNLFHKQESGFSSKEGLSRDMTRRKLLFCLYALLIPVPLLDSIRLACVHRDVTFLLHFVYLYYVCVQIFWLGVVRLTGGDRKNKNYGK